MTRGRAAQHSRKCHAAPLLAIVRINMCTYVYVHAGSNACVSGKGTADSVFKRTGLSSVSTELLWAGRPQGCFWRSGLH